MHAHEGRDAATFYIPGVCSHASMPPEKKLFLKLRGKFVDIMSDVNSESLQHTRYEKREKVSCLNILKAVHGLIDSAFLWCNLFSINVTKMGFLINKVDRFVIKKINGKQCTIYCAQTIIRHHMLIQR